MSGFLDRMAARAGGVAAEVTPRVPAFFESAPLSPVELVATSPVPPVEPVATSSVPPVEPVETSSVMPVEPVETSPVPPVEPVAASPLSPKELVESSPLSPVEPAARSPLPAPATRSSHPATRPSRPTALVVPAVPVVLDAAAAASAVHPSSESLGSTRRGPDVVKVSIGRVDVRVPAAHPRPPAREVPVPAAKADRLSLQDYLRGQRGTP